MTCTDCPDVVYPLLADVYYPVVHQSGYGNVLKTWTLDRSVTCSFTVTGLKNKKDVVPNSSIVLDNALIGRTRKDLRISSDNVGNAITNILVTNIRDKNSNVIYTETSGVRAGSPTIFEIATNDPIVGPFGNIEYYKVILRRSENQEVTI
jgi:hypothetical protein